MRFTNREVDTVHTLHERLYPHEPQPQVGRRTPFRERDRRGIEREIMQQIVELYNQPSPDPKKIEQLVRTNPAEPGPGVVAWNYENLLIVEKNVPSSAAMGALASISPNAVIPFSRELNDTLLPKYMRTTDEQERKRLLGAVDADLVKSRHLMDKYLGVVDTERDFAHVMESARTSGTQLLAAGPAPSRLEAMDKRYTHTADWGTDQRLASWKIGSVIGYETAIQAKETFGDEQTTVFVNKYTLDPFFEAYTGKQLNDALPLRK